MARYKLAQCILTISPQAGRKPQITVLYWNHENKFEENQDVDL
jgi:hypothetical protein